jgi:hypothetical protein
MTRYRKLLIALVGAAVIALNDLFDIQVGYEASAIIDTTVALGVAFGVFAVPNT